MSAELPDDVVAEMKLNLANDDLQIWNAKWTSGDGTVLLEIEGRQTRRDTGGDETKEVTPHQAEGPAADGPQELRRLEGFIGDWNAEVRDNLAAEPAWNRANASHKSWTLGGRFVRDEVRDAEGQITLLGLWTCDANEGTHREWYFFPDGNAVQVKAIWDQASSTMKLDGQWTRGGTLRGTRKLTSADTYSWEVVSQDPTGNVVTNMSGRQSRQSPN
jgi:hypothetical protein